MGGGRRWGPCSPPAPACARRHRTASGTKTLLVPTPQGTTPHPIPQKHSYAPPSLPNDPPHPPIFLLFPPPTHPNPSLTLVGVTPSPPTPPRTNPAPTTPHIPGGHRPRGAVGVGGLCRGQAVGGSSCHTTEVSSAAEPSPRARGVGAASRPRARPAGVTALARRGPVTDARAMHATGPPATQRPCPCPTPSPSHPDIQPVQLGVRARPCRVTPRILASPR